MIGRYGSNEIVTKAYNNIVRYRYVMLTLELIFIDSIDYDDADSIKIEVNSKEEFLVIGKNFNSSANSGSSNVCGGSTDDLIVTYTIK